jgi:hypothetical protein
MSRGLPVATVIALSLGLIQLPRRSLRPTYWHGGDGECTIGGTLRPSGSIPIGGCAIELRYPGYADTAVATSAAHPGQPFRLRYACTRGARSPTYVVARCEGYPARYASPWGLSGDGAKTVDLGELTLSME